MSFQSAVNACAVLFIALNKIVFEKSIDYVYKYTKSEVGNQTKTERTTEDFISCPMYNLKNSLLAWREGNRTLVACSPSYQVKQEKVLTSWAIRMLPTFPNRLVLQ